MCSSIKCAERNNDDLSNVCCVGQVYCFSGTLQIQILTASNVTKKKNGDEFLLTDSTPPFSPLLYEP